MLINQMNMSSIAKAVIKAIVFHQLHRILPSHQFQHHLKVNKHLYHLSATEIQTPIQIQMMMMMMSLIGDYLLIVQDKGLVEMAMVVVAMEMVDLEVLEEEIMVLHTQGTPGIQGILMVLVIQI